MIALPFDLASEQVIAAMAGLAAALTALAVWFALVPKRPGTARARALVARRAELKAAALTPQRRRDLRALPVMRTVVLRLDLLRSTQARRMTKGLAQAGWRSQEALIVYLFAKTVLPLAALAFAALMLYGLDALALAPLPKAGAACGFVLLAAYLPDLWVKNSATKRQDRIRKALPDGLDLLVICAEAGLSLDLALTRVAQEMELACVELADEFALTAVELGFLPDRRQALHNLTERSEVDGLRALVSALTQTEKYGTPLAQSLRVLAADLRTERMMKAEEKAARLPVALTVPMVLFILPPLFVVLIGPAILKAIDAMAGQ